MTCVVAVENKGRVYMAADSAGVDDSLGIETRLDRKIFWNNGYLIGFSGSFRAGQIIKHKFSMPDFPSEFLPPDFPDEKICMKNLPEDILLRAENFFVTDFIEAMQQSFAECSFELKEGEDFQFLVAYGPYMFVVYSDLQVSICPDYAAIGSGGPVALGALAVTSGNPTKRLNRVLHAAAKHNAGVRAPFYHNHT